MNALHPIRTFILFGSVAVLALGAIAAPANAGNPYFDNYGCRKPCVYGNTLHFYPTAGLYGNFNGNNYGTYCVTKPYFPTRQFYSKRISCPVTLYDSFGRPYIVSQTSSSPFLR